jgi:hypothetical protein
VSTLKKSQARIASPCAQEGAPAQPVALRRRRHPGGRKHGAHQRRRHVDAELPQFADDADVAAVRVLARKAQGELARVLRTGGRPDRRCGYVQWPATSRRCQRRIVSGRTRNTLHERRGSTRLNAASTSRACGSNRGRPTCRRRTDNSWRSTRISNSFERSPRASNTTSANSRQATT